MSKECCIVAAGPSPLYCREGAYLIAADGGLEKLREAKKTPDLILGDFDSLPAHPEGENVLTFPAEKDDTDTMLAIKEALKRGYDRLYISGGIGGRLDHTLANLQSLLFAEKLGAEAFLCGEGVTVTAITRKCAEFSASCRGKISVFCFGDSASGVTIRGLKYETAGISLSNMFPLGVSNEFTGQNASISLERGTLILIWDGTPDDIRLVGPEAPSSHT